MQKICTRCEKEKELSEFHKLKQGKYGVCSYCKDCKNELHTQHRLNNLEKYAGYSKRRRLEKKEKSNNYDREYRNRYLRTIRGYTFKIFSSAKGRAKKKGLDFDLTSEWVLEKVTPMICEATGLKLEIGISKDCRCLPLQPTLDRIDSFKGYTMDNVRVVCWWWNVMKQDWTDETIEDLITKYLEHKQKNNE